MIHNENELQKTNKRYATYFLYCRALTILLTIIALFAASKNWQWLFVIVPPAILLFMIDQKKKKLQLWLLLKKHWLQPRKLTVDFLNLCQKMPPKETLETISLDYQTLADLEVDKLFTNLNRSFTTTGQNTLAYWLQHPARDPLEIHKRNSDGQQFIDNLEFREKCIFLLLQLGKEKHNQCGNFLAEQSKNLLSFKNISVYQFMILIPLILSFLVNKYFFLLLIPAFLTNLKVHLSIRQKHLCSPTVLSYIKELILTGKFLSAADSQNILTQSKILHDLSTKTNYLCKIGYYPAAQGEGIVNLIHKTFNIFLLLEAGSYLKLLRNINKHIVEIKQIYKVIGELDALQSIASYKKDLPYCCEPVFSNQTSIDAEELFLPLLANPVSNSLKLDLDTPLLITGTNMSGKSTYLRATGLAALMAQSLGFCPAKSYHTPIVAIKSSINRHDAVTQGKSLYFVEAERLLELINLQKISKVTNLLLIDEVLSGTNQVERIAASKEILLHLKNTLNLILVTTHDHELAVSLQTEYRCCYFSNNLINHEMIFDYRVKNGILSTTNALKILSLLNYPPQIVRNAEILANKLNVQESVRC